MKAKKKFPRRRSEYFSNNRIKESHKNIISYLKGIEQIKEENETPAHERKVPMINILTEENPSAENKSNETVSTIRSSHDKPLE